MSRNKQGNYLYLVHGDASAENGETSERSRR